MPMPTCGITAPSNSPRAVPEHTHLGGRGAGHLPSIQLLAQYFHSLTSLARMIQALRKVWADELLSTKVSLIEIGTLHCDKSS